MKVVPMVAAKLNVKDKEVQSTKLQPGTKDRPRSILVELKSKVLQQQWIDAGKEHSLTVGHILQNVPKEKAEARVYKREALTKHQNPYYTTPNLSY
ncbi:unnamed protein product [Arctia plantaginis]|uniref:FP protein N-terminal domain-containing protein n=1 Tax=Arctia plantaginis TaxID=874455 RepID=A0A8S1BNK1_ARCPL|nr:unnamed protein product [Arctia plantaginis]